MIIRPLLVSEDEVSLGSTPRDQYDDPLTSEDRVPHGTSDDSNISEPFRNLPTGRNLLLVCRFLAVETRQLLLPLNRFVLVADKSMRVYPMHPAELRMSGSSLAQTRVLRLQIYSLFIILGRAETSLWRAILTVGLKLQTIILTPSTRSESELVIAILALANSYSNSTFHSRNSPSSQRPWLTLRLRITSMTQPLEADDLDDYDDERVGQEFPLPTQAVMEVTGALSAERILMLSQIEMRGWDFQYQALTPAVGAIVELNWLSPPMFVQALIRADRQVVIELDQAE